MQIIKKSSVPQESAHGVEGRRQLFLSDKDSSSSHFQAFTKGFLPSKGKFSWHAHEKIEEMMLVLKGDGVVRDRDGDYKYTSGDFFIFPAGVEHEIENKSNYENEYIFVRIRI